MFINKNKVVPTPPNKTSEVICHAELVSASIQYHPTSILPVQGGRIVTKNYKSAFTLAEVLITLVIIGVIAAITVPTLINNTNKQEYVSKLRKVHSTLVQATNLIIANEGTPRADKGGWATDAGNIYNMYKKYLLNAKECNEEIGCWPQHAKTLSGADASFDDYPNTSRLLLNDGTQVMFRFSSEDCSNSWDGSDGTCAQIYVDLNGARKPNLYGTDVFRFTLKENGLYPTGCDSEEQARCFKGENGHGGGCACKVLREGAINY